MLFATSFIRRFPNGELTSKNKKIDRKIKNYFSCYVGTPLFSLWGRGSGTSAPLVHFLIGTAFVSAVRIQSVRFRFSLVLFGKIVLFSVVIVSPERNVVTASAHWSPSFIVGLRNTLKNVLSFLGSFFLC